MKNIALCADDFGMHPKVSEAIALLASQQRLSATSCLVTSEHWQQDSQLLSTLRPFIDIGLHLNFSEGKGISSFFRQGLPGLGAMLWKSHCRLFPQKYLKEEIRAQLQCFMDTTGQTPDFIDGHQHVHHLPQVRKALFEAFNEMGLNSLWLRCATPLVVDQHSLKSRIIEYSGAHGLAKQAQQTGIKINRAFAGVYSLSERESFPQLMTSWLEQLPDNGLIMCHPAYYTEEIDHGKARQLELDYLGSEQFMSDLTSQQARLYRPSV